MNDSRRPSKFRSVPVIGEHLWGAGVASGSIFVVAGVATGTTVATGAGVAAFAAIGVWDHLKHRNSSETPDGCDAVIGNNDNADTV